MTTLNCRMYFLILGLRPCRYTTRDTFLLVAFNYRLASSPTYCPRKISERRLLSFACLCQLQKHPLSVYDAHSGQSDSLCSGNLTSLLVCSCKPAALDHAPCSRPFRGIPSHDLIPRKWCESVAIPCCNNELFELCVRKLGAIDARYSQQLVTIESSILSTRYQHSCHLPCSKFGAEPFTKCL